MNTNKAKSTNNIKSNERVNQLTSAENFDVKRIVFSEPQIGTVPNTTPPISYKRINISVLNPDSSVGDLILPTGRLFSFGVSENINPETKKVNGHVLPLCLWNRDGASKEEKVWTETFDKIVEHCKQYLVDNREEIEQYELSREDLKKLNPLYWKKEKGKIVEGTGPTLYAKVIASKKHDKILSMFFNDENETLDPMSLLGKYCYATAAVKIESVFLGNKISLQVKLYEAKIELMEGGMPSLLSRPKGQERILGGGKFTTMNDVADEEDKEDHDDIKAEDDEPVVQAPKVLAKKPTIKVKAK